MSEKTFMFVGGPAHESDRATGGVACYLVPVALPFPTIAEMQAGLPDPGYEVAEYERELLQLGPRLQVVYRFKRYRSW